MNPLEILDAMVTKMETKHPFSFYVIYNHIILPDEQRPYRGDGVVLCGVRGLAQWGL
jgi:hypothetical protein